MTNQFIDGYYLGSDGAWTDNIPTDTKINPANVRATKSVVDKLLDDGWVMPNSYWYGSITFLYLKDRKDSAHYDTTCWIKNGVATIEDITMAQN